MNKLIHFNDLFESIPDYKKRVVSMFLMEIDVD